MNQKLAQNHVDNSEKEPTDAQLDAMVFPSGAVPWQSRRYLERKEGIERAVAAIAIVLLSPFFALCYLAVRLGSPGPAIFAQRRTGAGGKTFVMFKFRSMPHNIEQYTGKRWSPPGDRRVNLVGKFLRFTHLDELPQLYNVMRGDMSLIGPRPERPEFVSKLIDKVDGYARRHAIKPGITGLAQIFLPADVDVDSVRRKIIYDLVYLKYAGFSMDLQIAICTVFRMCGLRWGIGPRITGLSRRVNRLRAESRLRILKQRKQTQPAKIPSPNSKPLVQAFESFPAAMDSGITRLICQSDSSLDFGLSSSSDVALMDEPRRRPKRAKHPKRPR